MIKFKKNIRKEMKEKSLMALYVYKMRGEFKMK
jgi:hypothetical protein